MTYAWVAAGVAALVSAGAGYYNNQQVAKKQDNATAEELRQQGMLQQKAQQQTGDLIKTTAASNDTGAKASVLDQFMAEMQKKQGQGNTGAGLNQVGNVSSAYTKAANDAAAGVSNYGNTTANLLASIDAPSIQRQNEAANLSQYATGIGTLKQNSAALDFLTQMKLRGIQPNPWITAVSDVAGSYAKTGGAGFGGTGAGTGSALGTVDGAGNAGGSAFGGSVGYAPAPGFGSYYGFGS